jgi:hypothetical protein
MNLTKPPLLPLILDDVPLGLRRALGQEGIPFRDRRPGTPEGRFVLFDSRIDTRWALAPGQTAIDVDALRVGWDEDPLEMLTDRRTARMHWDADGLPLVEEVARVDKRAVRRSVLDRLRAKIEAAGGVWLRISAFPFPHRAAFNFRIDYDRYHPRDFRAVIRAIAGREHATSHFVNGAAYQAFPEALAWMRSLDVGSHGYWHHTYRTAEENYRNVQRGIETLLAADLEPAGFVAPHGRFNDGLLQALEQLGVTHSSEFGLAYDELPFFPSAGPLLQIPVHPVCLGLFLDAAKAGGAGDADAAVGRAIEYFQGVARAKYRLGEPIFFYGHPTGRVGRYPQLLDRVFQTVSGFGAVWETTLSEFARWWRARARIRLSVLRHKTGFAVRVDQQPADYRVGIDYWRGPHVASMPLDRRVVKFSPSALAYENRAAGPPPGPIRVDRPEGLRGRIRRLIDWEQVTPIEEIGSQNWRNWAKRTLRKIRS